MSLGPEELGNWVVSPPQRSTYLVGLQEVGHRGGGNSSS